MTRREFLEVLAIASAAGLRLGERRALAGEPVPALYDLPRFGNVSLLHLTDCHAQLRPLHYREPSVNLGTGAASGRPPHLVGEALLRRFGIPRASADAYAFAFLDFERAATAYGKVGGFAHLATLIKKLRAERPGALLLDGGDSWQGSATALWSRGQDMVEACLLLGVNVMTAHWEFTYGAERVTEIVNGAFRGRVDFVAQNLRTADFGDPVFPPYVLREVNGVPVGIIGQAYPYTAIAHPRRFVSEWTFGIQEQGVQRSVDAVRSEGAAVVALLSHNGMDVDLKLASRVSGLDAILGGHTHDAVPAAIEVSNAGGKTLVTNAGSHGKFLGVLDLEVKAGRTTGYRYKLLPVFANQVAPDPEMSALIDQLRAPFESRLSETLAVTQGLLYRRGNFNGTFDQLILDALLDTHDAQIAFSPGFRWGTTLLPGEPITREHLMDQTAITYPDVTLSEMSGENIKAVLEDVCDNLFNSDPYKQQGGDMMRVGGLTYACAPNARMGNRISDLRLSGTPIAASKKYKVAGWAPVTGETGGTPIWELVENWLKQQKSIAPRQAYLPRLIGVDGNPGIG